MNCRECESILARDEPTAEAQAHLARCPACRALALELRANAEALAAMASEEVGRVSLPAIRPRPWKWIPAVAAMLAVGFGIRVASRPPTVATTVTVRENAIVTPAVEPAKPEVGRTPRSAAGPLAGQPLVVKMLTPDPDIVIYWLIEPTQEGGTL